MIGRVRTFVSYWMENEITHGDGTALGVLNLRSLRERYLAMRPESSSERISVELGTMHDLYVLLVMKCLSYCLGRHVLDYASYR